MRELRSKDLLQYFIEKKFGAPATFLYKVPVRHLFGVMLWSGTVAVFNLKRQNDSVEAYAWFCPFGGEVRAAVRCTATPGAAEAVLVTLNESARHHAKQQPSAERSTP